MIVALCAWHLIIHYGPRLVGSSGYELLISTWRGLRA
jgi:hypothetical protein